MFMLADIGVFNAIMHDYLGQDHTVRSASHAGLSKVQSTTKEASVEDRKFATDCLRLYRKGQITKRELAKVLTNILGKTQSRRYLSKLPSKQTKTPHPVVEASPTALANPSQLRHSLHQAVIKHRLTPSTEENKAKKEQEQRFSHAADVANTVVSHCWARLDPRYRDTKRATTARDYVTQYLVNRWSTPGVDAGRLTYDTREMLVHDVMMLLAGDAVKCELDALRQWVQEKGF